MTNWGRRRILQAGLAAGSVPLLKWDLARAQSPDRNLMAAERQAAPGFAGSLSLLGAPRRALVIGNSAYGFGPLKNPANDARAIADELKRTGFEVVTGLDLSRKEMLEAIRAYGESIARAKAVGLFYFAGHGVQLAWRNYLLPTDAVVQRIEDIQSRGVDVNAVIEGIAKAANPMNVVILDACRDNPFARSGKVEQKGLSQLDAPPGTLLAYATSPGNIASDGDGVNGLYTEQLLREILVPEAKIEDVFKRVRLAVRRRSNGQQIPWESTSLEEDFWFIPSKEMKRLADEEVERTRREQEAERVLKEKLERAGQEKLERARQEELERLRREREAGRARQEELQRVRREQLEREREEKLERAYQEEFELWERVSGAKAPGPLEDYLRRFPSGHFAELAQLQLDAVLARQGEKPIQVASSEGNPFTQGFVRADTAFKVGDSYSYVQLDRDTKQEQRRFTSTVTQVTDTEVIFNDGVLIYDRLGNTVKLPDGRRFTPRQDQPLEYAIGKKWTTRFSVVAPQGRSADSEFNFRITRREKISVPAGTFDCFVIEGDGYATTDRGFRIRLGLTRWMAPDKVRRPIVSEQFRKFERRAGAPMGFGKGPGAFGKKGPAGVLNNERLELVAFKQS
jgi:hypothetical protein